jgi:hypothetical protein
MVFEIVIYIIVFILASKLFLEMAYYTIVRRHQKWLEAFEKHKASMVKKSEEKQ